MKILDLNYFSELEEGKAIQGGQPQAVTPAIATATATSSLDVFQPTPGTLVFPFAQTNTSASFRQTEEADVARATSSSFAGGLVVARQ